MNFLRYGAPVYSINRRFAQVPVLQKPIERQMLRNVFVDGRGRVEEAIVQ